MGFFAVPNEATPLQTEVEKSGSSGGNQVPVVAITTSSNDFGNNNHFIGSTNNGPQSHNSSREGLQAQAPLDNHFIEAATAVDTVDTEDEDDEELLYPWQKPEDAGFFSTISWLTFFPINLLFFLTIPDMRRVDPDAKGFFRRLYPFSFVMCMAWIGAISYVVTWMITIIGFTIGVPDSVMGLSFLAIGTSIPEVFSSLIVSRQGKGSMAVSNSIGSNTFDILVCLGVPWLVKSVMTGVEGSDKAISWMIQVNSEGLGYTVMSLLLSLVILYVILLLGKFEVTKAMGIICLVIYVVFLTISLLFELNVFFIVNLPTCSSDY